MKPHVTIALSVYNGGSTLKLAVQSILNQSFQNWELIILDDASTDNSLEVMQSFDDPRIRLVEGKENIGLSARLNMSVDMAKGDYFARMDQDDISFPERIEQQVCYLQTHPEVDLLATNYAVFKDNFEWLGKLFVQQQHKDICRKPWNGFYMPHPTWMGKLEWFRQHHYKSYADGAEDQNLLLSHFESSHFSCLSDVLLAYRQNERSLPKVLRARTRYVKSAFISYFSGDGVQMPVRVLVAQLAKGCGDIIYILFNIPRLHRILQPLEKSEKVYLQKIIKGLRSEL